METTGSTKTIRIVTMFLIMAAAAAFSADMHAQAQITTKNEKIEDFPEKTTKIVLSGQEFFDAALKEEVMTRWNVSPFEFCTMDDFNRLKSDSDYYFLVPLKGQFRRESEPSIEMLSLLKGGDGADKSLDKMLEIVSIPVRAARYPSGREFIFLSALLDIIQEYVIYALDRGINAYSTLADAAEDISRAGGMRIIFSEGDLSPKVTEEIRELYFRDGVAAADEEIADDFMLNNVPNTLISYTVAPSDPVPGSYCYKMLIDAGTHRLYYYRKQRIGRNSGPGFQPDDIMRITSGRN